MEDDKIIELFFNRSEEAVFALAEKYGASYGIQYNDFREDTGHEIYVNAAGREFDIVTFTDVSGADAITAITDIDGYLVYVDFRCFENVEALRQTMVEVLEAYK